MIASTVTDHTDYLALVSSDEEFDFTLDTYLVTEAVGISSVELAAHRDQLEEGREFVFVSNDANEIEEHFTKGGIVKLGASIDSEQSRAFANECAGFIPSW